MGICFHTNYCKILSFYLLAISLQVDCRKYHPSNSKKILFTTKSVVTRFKGGHSPTNKDVWSSSTDEQPSKSSHKKDEQKENRPLQNQHSSSQRAPFSDASKHTPVGAKMSSGNAPKQETPLFVKDTGFAPIHFLKEMFPIELSEMRKFFAMSIMMFAIIFIFTMTRDTKDTLVVTNCGAEAIAFLKVYGVVPAATGFMIIYSFLAHHFSKRTVFYVTITPFFVFFALFAYVMYPMRSIFHAQAGREQGLSYLVNLGRYWMFSVYYIVAEIWGSAGVPLLFWQCANEVTSIPQAKRFYPLFALVGNLAPIASGLTMKFATKKREGIDPELAFEHSLKVLTGIMLLGGAVVMGLYDYVHDLHDLEVLKSEDRPPDLEKSTHLKDFPRIRPPARGNIQSKFYKQVARPASTKKPKMGMIESFRFLLSSRYLGCLAVMVISYGLSMEFTEIIWKAMIKKAYPDKNQYMNFMGNYSAYVGYSTILMLIIGGKIIKHLGWEVGALMTPVAMAALALPFFGYITFGSSGETSASKGLMAAVLIGTVQNIFSKATKYALFDPTKEMAYIPLDKESKSKGKAAIDVLGARLGKSGGALAQQALVIWVGSILNAAPILGVLFYGVITVWIAAVLQLSKMFHKHTAEKDAGQ